MYSQVSPTTLRGSRLPSAGLGASEGIEYFHWGELDSRFPEWCSLRVPASLPWFVKAVMAFAVLVVLFVVVIDLAAFANAL